MAQRTLGDAREERVAQLGHGLSARPGGAVREHERGGREHQRPVARHLHRLRARRQRLHSGQQVDSILEDERHLDGHQLGRDHERHRGSHPTDQRGLGRIPQEEQRPVQWAESSLAQLRWQRWRCRRGRLRRCTERTSTHAAEAVTGDAGQAGGRRCRHAAQAQAPRRCGEHGKDTTRTPRPGTERRVSVGGAQEITTASAGRRFSAIPKTRSREHNPHALSALPAGRGQGVDLRA